MVLTIKGTVHGHLIFAIDSLFLNLSQMYYYDLEISEVQWQYK